MKHPRRARYAGLVCLGGATVQIIYGLLSIRFPFYDVSTYYGWDEALWILANVGMIGAALGLLTLDVARPRWLGVIGAGLSVLGNLLRIVVSVLLIVAPANSDAYVPFILLSIVLMVLGMGTLGVAILLGKQLPGWHAWTPLLAGGCALLIAPTYSINLPLHFLLLGLWGIPWLLVGYAIVTQVAIGEQAMQVRASGARGQPGAGFTKVR